LVASVADPKAFRSGRAAACLFLTGTAQAKELVIVEDDPSHGVPISILDIAEPHGPLALAGERTIGERKPASAFDLTQGGHRPQR
jgi:hypothetical protein